MVDWWDKRTAWLNTELNKVDVLPADKTFTPEASGYSATPQTVTLISYGDMTGLSATFQKAESSGFEIGTELSKTSTGNGGYLATISVKPKMSLPVATYTDTLVLSGNNQGKSFSLSVPLNFVVNVDTEVSILTPDRVIPQSHPNKEAIVAAPVNTLTGEFTAGPNPLIRKRSGIVNFYRQGKRVRNSELRIYDAAGNSINKVKISDNAIGTQARRQVGAWNLCDRNGRIVSEGTYVVKGVVKTSDGKSEKVSVILSVR
jgi:hypothetical protein